MPYPLAFVAAGLLCFAIGWVLGYPALRVQHHYLAFVTLAFSTLVFLVFSQRGMADRRHLRHQCDPAAERLRLVDEQAARLITISASAFSPLISLCVWWIMRSPWGRAFVALRENPLRALSLGVDTRRYTLMAFAIGSGLGGLSGALYAPLVQFIDPAPFALQPSLDLLLMVIVGGCGIFLGPFVGALIAVLLPEWLRFTEGYYLIIYAALVMLLMPLCPSGLVGMIERAYKSLTTKRGPSAPAVPVERAMP